MADELKRSRNLRDGDLCMWHGDKLVKAGRRAKKWAGVWYDAHESEMLLPDKTRVTIKTPAGLVVFGHARCKRADIAGG